MKSTVLIWQTFGLQERLLIVFIILIAVVSLVIFYLQYQADLHQQGHSESLTKIEKIIAKANQGDEDAIEACNNDYRVMQYADIQDDGVHKRYQLTSVARQRLEQLRC